MKAIEILDVISREPISSDMFGVVHVVGPMCYSNFVKHYLCKDYEETIEDSRYIIKGAIFYCWSSLILDFPNSDDVHLHSIGGEYLYVIEVE